MQVSGYSRKWIAFIRTGGMINKEFWRSTYKTESTARRVALHYGELSPSQYKMLGSMVDVPVCGPISHVPLEWSEVITLWTPLWNGD
jgi:hypothetical protein